MTRAEIIQAYRAGRIDRESARRQLASILSTEASDTPQNTITPSVTSTQSEPDFKQWYLGHAQKWGLNEDPDAPEQQYDYRAAFKAGAAPDETGHWPSEYKMPKHPNRFIDGVDSTTGKSIADSDVDTIREAYRQGKIDRDTARQQIAQKIATQSPPVPAPAPALTSPQVPPQSPELPFSEGLVRAPGVGVSHLPAALLRGAASTVDKANQVVEGIARGVWPSDVYPQSEMGDILRAGAANIGEGYAPQSGPERYAARTADVAGELAPALIPYGAAGQVMARLGLLKNVMARTPLMNKVVQNIAPFAAVDVLTEGEEGIGPSTELGTTFGVAQHLSRNLPVWGKVLANMLAFGTPPTIHDAPAEDVTANMLAGAIYGGMHKEPNEALEKARFAPPGTFAKEVGEVPPEPKPEPKPPVTVVPPRQPPPPPPTPPTPPTPWPVEKPKPVEEPEVEPEPTLPLTEPARPKRTFWRSRYEGQEGGRDVSQDRSFSEQIANAYGRVSGMSPDLRRITEEVEVDAQNPLDWQSEDALESLRPDVEEFARKHHGPEQGQRVADEIMTRALRGDWGALEHPAMEAAARKAGYDSIFTRESGANNLRVFDPSKIRTVGPEPKQPKAEPALTEQDLHQIRAVKRELILTGQALRHVAPDSPQAESIKATRRALRVELNRLKAKAPKLPTATAPPAVEGPTEADRLVEEVIGRRQGVQEEKAQPPEMGSRKIAKPEVDAFNAFKEAISRSYGPHAEGLKLYEGAETRTMWALRKVVKGVGRDLVLYTHSAPNASYMGFHGWHDKYIALRVNDTNPIARIAWHEIGHELDYRNLPKFASVVESFFNQSPEYRRALDTLIQKIDKVVPENMSDALRRSELNALMFEHVSDMPAFFEYLRKNSPAMYARVWRGLSRVYMQTARAFGFKAAPPQNANDLANLARVAAESYLEAVKQESASRSLVERLGLGSDLPAARSVSNWLKKQGLEKFDPEQVAVPIEELHTLMDQVYDKIVGKWEKLYPNEEFTMYALQDKLDDPDVIVPRSLMDLHEKYKSLEEAALKTEVDYEPEVEELGDIDEFTPRAAQDLPREEKQKLEHTPLPELKMRRPSLDVVNASKMEKQPAVGWWNYISSRVRPAERALLVEGGLEKELKSRSGEVLTKEQIGDLIKQYGGEYKLEEWPVGREKVVGTGQGYEMYTLPGERKAYSIQSMHIPVEQRTPEFVSDPEVRRAILRDLKGRMRDISSDMIQFGGFSSDELKAAYANAEDLHGFVDLITTPKHWETMSEADKDYINRLAHEVYKEESSGVGEERRLLPKIISRVPKWSDPHEDLPTPPENMLVRNRVTVRGKLYVIEERQPATRAEGIPKAFQSPAYWGPLSLKMAIRDALKRGLRNVAWTTGQQQKDRYFPDIDQKNFPLEHVRKAAELKSLYDDTLLPLDRKFIEELGGEVRTIGYGSKKLNFVKITDEMARKVEEEGMPRAAQNITPITDPRIKELLTRTPPPSWRSRIKNRVGEILDEISEARAETKGFWNKLEKTVETAAVELTPGKEHIYFGYAIRKHPDFREDVLKLNTVLAETGYHVERDFRKIFGEKLDRIANPGDMEDFENAMRLMQEAYNVERDIVTAAETKGLGVQDLYAQVDAIRRNKPKVAEAMEAHRALMDHIRGVYTDQGRVVMWDNPYYVPDQIMDASSPFAKLWYKHIHKKSPVRLGTFREREGSPELKQLDYLDYMGSYLRHFYEASAIFDFGTKTIAKYGILVPPGIKAEQAIKDLPKTWEQWTPPQGDLTVERLLDDLIQADPAAWQRLTLAKHRALSGWHVVPTKGVTQYWAPKEIVEALKELEVKESPGNALIRQFTGWWKAVTLGTQGLPFQLMQVMGDTFNMYIANAMAVKNIPQAAIWRKQNHPVFQLAEMLGSARGYGKGEARAELQFSYLKPGQPLIKKPLNLAKRAVKKTSDVSEAREEIWRLALFAQELRDRGLMKGGELTAPLEQLANDPQAIEAARYSRESLIDYMKKTRLMKRLTSGALPWMQWPVEEAKVMAKYTLQHPAKMAAKIGIPLAMLAAWHQDKKDRWGRDIAGLLPTYMFESNIPIVLDVDKERDEATVFLLNFPLKEMRNWATSPARKLGSALSPLVTAVGEWIGGKDWFTGRPIPGKPTAASLGKRLFLKAFTPAQQLQQVVAKREREEKGTTSGIEKYNIFGGKAVIPQFSVPIFKVNLAKSAVRRRKDELINIIENADDSDVQQLIREFGKKWGGSIYTASQGKLSLSAEVQKLLYIHPELRDNAKKLLGGE